MEMLRKCYDCNKVVIIVKNGNVTKMLRKSRRIVTIPKTGGAVQKPAAHPAVRLNSIIYEGAEAGSWKQSWKLEAEE